MILALGQMHSNKFANILKVMTKRVLIAPNAFKHSLAALEAAKAIECGIKLSALNCKTVICPIADGGDGTIDVIKYHIRDAKYVNCSTYDPLMRKIKSKWLLLNKSTAFIELSKASGINLLKKKELNPLKTTTYGTGILIKSALNKGCKRIVISIGGSATVDAGIGILSALGVRFLGKNKKTLFPCGNSLSKIKFADFSKLDSRIAKCQIDVICDVQNPLLGKKGAVKCYAKQKGASVKDQIILEKGMLNIVKVFNSGTLYKKPMTGAAGGVAFGLLSLLNVKLSPGFNYIGKLISIGNKIKKSDIVITGEGYLDKQTLFGKGVFGVVKIAKKYQKVVVVICGDFDREINWQRTGIDYIFPLKTKYVKANESLRKAKTLMRKIVMSKSKLLNNC